MYYSPLLIQHVRRARFTRAESSCRAEYDRIFKAPIFFDSDRNALLTDQEFLFLKQPSINRYIVGVLNDSAGELLKSLKGSKTTRGRVEHLLIPILHKGELRMDVIVKAMGISRQTLYRKLKAEGVEYKGVLDVLRHTMVLHFLNGNRASVSETAYLMGFLHPAAFSRAFKRWTGETPRAYRSRRRSTDENAAVKKHSGQMKIERERHIDPNATRLT